MRPLRFRVAPLKVLPDVLVGQTFGVFNETTDKRVQHKGLRFRQLQVFIDLGVLLADLEG